MSLDREYETSKIGPTTTIAFLTASQTRIRLTDGKKRSFRLRATQDVRIQQGDSKVSTSITGTAKGMLLETTYVWRVDVDSPKDAFIAVQGDTANGNLEITLLTDADTTDLPTAV